jgi:hypothetical protein
MRYVTVLLMLLLPASAVSAQSTTGVFGGYLYSHPNFENVHISMGDSLKGWLGGVDVSITDHLGILARADGAYGDVFRQGLVIRSQGDQVRSTLYTATVGPRLSVRHANLTIFANGAAGVARGTARNMGVDFLGVAEDTKFVGGAGGGVDLHLSPLLDLQADIQYRRTNLFDQTLNVVQVGAGIVLRPTRR